MDISEMTTASLNKRLTKLQSQAMECFPLIRGSLTVVGGKQQDPRFTWTAPDKKRHSLYLGVNKEPIAKKYHLNYTRLDGIIGEASEISIELLRRLDVPRAKKSPKNL